MHRTERVRGQRAHHDIDLPAELRASVLGTNGYRDNELQRVLPAHRGDRGPHGGTGGQSVVDDDHHPIPQVRRRTSSPVLEGPAVQFEQLAVAYRIEVGGRDTQSGNDCVVRNHLNPVTNGGNGTHGQLRLTGYSELADDQDIQRCTQGTRDLHRDRHSTARQSENDHIVATHVPAQQSRQRPAGSRPVGEPGRARPEAHPFSQALLGQGGNC